VENPRLVEGDVRRLSSIGSSASPVYFPGLVLAVVRDPSCEKGLNYENEDDEDDDVESLRVFGSPILRTIST
jgi:hypothetical protein